MTGGTDIYLMSGAGASTAHVDAGNYQKMYQASVADSES